MIVEVDDGNDCTIAAIMYSFSFYRENFSDDALLPRFFICGYGQERRAGREENGHFEGGSIMKSA